jgi:hypothetical protein
LHKELRGLRALGALFATYCSLNQFTEDASGLLQGWLCAPSRVLRSGTGVPPVIPNHGRDTHAAVTSITQREFAAAFAQARHDLRTTGPKFVASLRKLFILRAMLERILPRSDARY